MMKKLMVVAALAALISVVGAASQKPDPKRMEALWGAATDRLTKQDDAWFLVGDYPRIVENLRYMHELDPNDYETATNLGWMLENIERSDEALAVYIDYRKKNPNVGGSEFPEANFYYQHKLYSKVPPLIEPRIAARHATANTFRILAHAYEKLNLFSDAKRTWNEYIAVEPNDAAAKANLSRVDKKLLANSKP